MDMSRHGGYSSYRNGGREEKNWKEQLEFAAEQLEKERPKKELHTFVVYFNNAEIVYVKASYWEINNDRGHFLEFRTGSRWLASFNLDLICGWRAYSKDLDGSLEEIDGAEMGVIDPNFINKPAV